MVVFFGFSSAKNLTAVQMIAQMTLVVDKTFRSTRSTAVVYYQSIIASFRKKLKHSASQATLICVILIFHHEALDYSTEIMANVYQSINRGCLSSRATSRLMTVSQ